ncbi:MULTISPECIES: cell division protein FtsQ/DivIB [Flammeovirga]|uniref:Cell division protein FtsQ n=1 Tax=Flammeovirga agarivorans TaxID=2726742 RepID=A0A7X8SH83_9BACT|nr:MULTISPECIES: hypothetical protein [Flammeovirga]NLR90087.1 hypothetical protein [Flammeovirga agarivorans]
MSKENKIQQFFKQKGAISLTVVIFLVLLSIVFTVTRPNIVNEGEMIINVTNYNAPRFVEATEVKDAVAKMNLDRTDQGMSIKEIENSLNAIQFVRNAEVSRDVKNNLVIDIEQDRPIARILTPSGKSTYINQEGKMIGLSKKHAARVLLITGAGAEKLMSQNYWEDSYYTYLLLEFVNKLSNDRFWNAQITQLDINKDMSIIAYPQVGKERIEFGQPTDYLKKLGKLKLYYNTIVSTKGWNVYKNIKLQYAGQIVCD